MPLQMVLDGSGGGVSCSWHSLVLRPLEHFAGTCHRQGRTLRYLSHADSRPVASGGMSDFQMVAYSREIIRGNPEPSGDRCHRLSSTSEYRSSRLTVVLPYGCLSIANSTRVFSSGSDST